MRHVLLAAAAALALGVAPAFAGEAPAGLRPTDVGSQAFPGTAGLPGSELPGLAADATLPQTGNERPVQTANSLPGGFADGATEYAQATRVRAWVLAHDGRPASVYATRVAQPRG